MNVIVTGVSGKIGGLITEFFLKKGYNVHSSSRNLDLVQRKKYNSLCTNKNHFFFNKIDLSNRKSLNRWFRIVKKRTKKIEFLINCAATSGEVESFKKTSTSSWVKTFNINFFSVVNLIKLFIPILNNKRSIVVNILGAGVGWKNNSKNKSQYFSSKFALAGFTEVLANELIDDGIVVIGIFPGPVDSKIRNKLITNKLSTKKNEDLSGKCVVRLFEEIINCDYKTINGKLISARFDDLKVLNKKNDSLFTLKRIDNKNYFF